jgi:hypothetical protein
MVSTLSPGASVVVESDVATETICLRVTATERQYIERQSRAELRTISNFLRSLIVERMAG